MEELLPGDPGSLSLDGGGGYHHLKFGPYEFWNRDRHQSELTKISGWGLGQKNYWNNVTEELFIFIWPIWFKPILNSRIRFLSWSETSVTSRNEYSTSPSGFFFNPKQFIRFRRPVRIRLFSMITQMYFTCPVSCKLSLISSVYHPILV